MPASRPASRRSVVPDGAGRSLWRSAVWTGAGAVVACAVLAIAAVAICWLPVSGPDARTGSAIRAGLLTFLASLHGGVTVDGTHAWWLPLGLPILVGAVCWRAGAGLADAAAALGEADPVRLAVAAGAQAATFAVGCALLVPFCALGSSGVPFFGVVVAALLWFSLTGGLAVARNSPLRAALAERVPPRLGRAGRAAAAAVAVYLAGGAVLVAGALVVHHRAVAVLTHRVGGGWGAVPILLLDLLAAPNAAICGAAYLSGAGFAVGAGSHVGPLTTTHATLPAFPLLGAVPTGHGATPVVLGLLAATALGAGAVLARRALRRTGWHERLVEAGAAVGLVAFFALLLGWQAGGAIGNAGLAAVGPSPWRFGLATAVLVGAAAALVLGVAAAAELVRAELVRAERPVAAVRVALVHRRDADTGGTDTGDTGGTGDIGDTGDADRRDELAG